MMVGPRAMTSPTPESLGSEMRTSTPGIAQPAVAAHQRLHTELDQLRLVAELAHDLAVERLPDRGDADHPGHRGLVERAVEQLGRALLEVRHRRAGRERHQEPRGELEGV